jgi:uncharacterized protein YqeY
MTSAFLFSYYKNGILMCTGWNSVSESSSERCYLRYLLRLNPSLGATPQESTGVRPFYFIWVKLMLHFSYKNKSMQEKIKSEIKAAMIAKDSVRLGTLRLLSAAFTNELVTQGRPPQEPLSDEDCMKVIKRLAKQRKDSIEQFIAGGRPDLAESEKAELAVVESFLPAQMSEMDIEEKVKAKLAQSPLDRTKKGQFIGMMMKELGDTADGALVKRVIDKLTA